MNNHNLEAFTSSDKEHHSIAMGRPKCTIRSPTRYDFEDLVSYALVTNSGDPTTFQEAMECQEKDRWMGTMMEEIESLHKNHLESGGASKREADSWTQMGL